MILDDMELGVIGLEIIDCCKIHGTVTWFEWSGMNKEKKKAAAT